MTTDNKAPTETDETDASPDYARIANAAAQSHAKRLEKAMEKAIEARFAAFETRMLAVLSPQGQTEPQESAQSAKPVKDKASDERFAAMERRLQEVENEKRALAEKGRKDGARAEIMRLLGEKGVSGARARALMHDFEASGALRYDDDGSVYLAVKRSRAKGMPAEEGVFDLQTGLDDWAQTQEAKDFLPTPDQMKQAARGPGQRPGQPAPPRPAPIYDPKTRSFNEAQALSNAKSDLAALGMDETRLLNLLTSG